MTDSKQMAGTILLVEDNEDDIFIFMRCFQEAKLPQTINVVTDGEQAVQYLAGEGKFKDRTKHPFPLLVLLDLKLPSRDGLEVLAWIAEQSFATEIHVVVLTSSGEERDIVKAYQLGARSYLIKPPDAQGLTELIHALAESITIRRNLHRLQLSQDLFGRLETSGKLKPTGG